jgi:hypothetical protein
LVAARRLLVQLDERLAERIGLVYPLPHPH